MAENSENNSYQGYQNYSNGPEENSLFDLHELWAVLMMYKYWFVASVLVCLAAAYGYLYFQTPVYKVSNKVLIKDQERTRTSKASVALAFGGEVSASQGFDNEMEIIKTRSMSSRVVRDLKLYTSYFIQGRMQQREIYWKDAPLRVDIEPMRLDDVKSRIAFDIKQDGNAYNIRVNTTAITEEGNKPFSVEKNVTAFPFTIDTPYGKVTVSQDSLRKSAILPPDGLLAYITPLDHAAAAYAGSLSAAPLSKSTSIAVLSKNDVLPQRAVEYLNKLVEMYNLDANEDANAEAERTRDFIEERLADISQDLSLTEGELESYKQSAGIVDHASDAAMAMSMNQQYDTELVDINTQIGLLDAMISEVNRSHLTMLPANIGIADGSVNGYVTQYNQLIMDRNRMLRSMSESAPGVVQITQQAEAVVGALKQSLNSSRTALNMKRSTIQGQKSRYAGRVSAAPSRERALGDIGRQQEVKSGLVSMLLQKREENLISLNSTAMKAKQIETPIISGPVSPNTQSIYLIALGIGLLLPFLYYFIRNFFRYRVENEGDLAKLSEVPLFGTIPFFKALAKGNRTIVLKENRNSRAMEVYRSLRSNLPFVLKPGQNVIMFTSSTSGEGKTVIAANLCASIAFAGKKVLLVGLDIRKPRLAQLFNFDDQDKGISNYLTRESDDFEYLESCIVKSDVSDNLDILPAGTTPPNPSELLERDNLEKAIKYLKTKYDYIVLDTAPIGLVSDTITISKFADVTFYIVRAHYTLKADIGLVNALNNDKKLNNVNVILNGTKDSEKSYSYRHYGYGYSYGYGKGYGYGYGRGYGYGYGYGGYGRGYGYGDKNLEEV